MYAKIDIYSGANELENHLNSSQMISVHKVQFVVAVDTTDLLNSLADQKPQVLVLQLVLTA